MWNLKNTRKKKQIHRYRELAVTSGEREEERDKIGVGIKSYKPLGIK